MVTMVWHTGLVTGRWLRTLRRQPAYLAFTLVQPVIWLLLFGQLFSRIGALPAFGGGGYLDYLTPGVVAMTAMSSAGWAGTSLIEDMKRGVMDRGLTSPVRRGALTGGVLVYQAVVAVAQSLIVLLVGYLAGARLGGGLAGVLVIVLSAVLLAVVFAALSVAAALLTRQQDALIGIFQFLTLPLTFLSSVMMAPGLMPGWVAAAARYNPLDWAAVASRAAVRPGTDWALVLRDELLLAVLAVVMAGLATLALRAYRRSV